MTWRARLAAASALSLVFLSLGFSAAEAQAGTVTYVYDGLGRVVGAAYPDGTCLAYSYDGSGNRTQYTSSTIIGVTAPPVSVTTYTSLANTFDPRIGVPTCGATLTVSAVGTPSHGTASIVSGGVGIIYTPTAGYTGADSFTYQLQAGGVSSPNGTVSVSVLAPTLAPTALNGYASAIFVVPPAVLPWAALDVTSLVSDPYGYAPTVSSVTQGAKGTVTFSGNTITYNYPYFVNSNKEIIDSYTYTVTDGHGHTATATVSVDLSVNTNQ